MRRIFHIDLDAFFVAAERILDPSLCGKPVIVGGNPEGRGVVSSASYEARRFGVKSGMPLAAARRLCPGAVFVRANFSHYRELSQRFMQILADTAPGLEPAGLDEAYLDVSDASDEGAFYVTLAGRLRERIRRELSLTASVGIACNKTVAKVASDRCKPDGLLDVPAGQERAFLAPLPVSALPGVGKKTEQTLKQMGVSTIGDLAALSPGLLHRRFGVTGEWLHGRANGIDDSPVGPRGPAKSMSRETTFEKDTRDTTLLEGTLREFAERLARDLREDGARATCITLKLRYADFSTIVRSHTVPHAVDDGPDIFAEGRRLLQAALAQRRDAVRLVGLRASNLTREERQLSLFDAEDVRTMRLNQAIDRIHARFGAAALRRGWAL